MLYDVTVNDPEEMHVLESVGSPGRLNHGVDPTVYGNVRLCDVLPRHDNTACNPVALANDFLDNELLFDSNQAFQDLGNTLPIDLATVVGGRGGVECRSAHSIPLRNQLKASSHYVFVFFDTQVL
jgi:hypothetical protein